MPKKRSNPNSLERKIYQAEISGQLLPGEKESLLNGNDDYARKNVDKNALKAMEIIQQTDKNKLVNCWLQLTAHGPKENSCFVTLNQHKRKNQITKKQKNTKKEQKDQTVSTDTKPCYDSENKLTEINLQTLITEPEDISDSLGIFRNTEQNLLGENSLIFDPYLDTPLFDQDSLANLYELDSLQ